MYRKALTFGISVFFAGITVACGGGNPTSPSPVDDPVPVPAPAPAPAPDPTPSPAPSPSPDPAPTPSPAPDPAPTPAPEAPFTQVLTGVVGATDGFGSEEDDWVHALNFTVPRDGLATFTLNWANGSNDLDLALSDAACTYLYAEGTASTEDHCVRYENTDDSEAKPERVSRIVKKGETYKIWLTNWAEESTYKESYQLEIDIR